MTRSDRTPQHWLDNPWIALGIGLAVGLLLLVSALEGAAQTLPAGFTAQKPPACTVEKCVGEKGEKGEKGDPGEPPPIIPPPAVGRFDTITPLLQGAYQIPVPRWDFAGAQDLLFFTPATGRLIYVDTVRTGPPGLWYLAPCYRIAPWTPPRPYTSVQVLRADLLGVELSFLDANVGAWWVHRWNFQEDPLSDGCIPIPGFGSYPPAPPTPPAP